MSEIDTFDARDLWFMCWEAVVMVGLVMGVVVFEAIRRFRGK
jgi:hypothetical protein